MTKAKLNTQSVESIQTPSELAVRPQALVAVHDNNFNLIRILAATEVLIAHAASHLGVQLPNWLKVVGGMFPGVPVFFVLSGFVISAALERSSSVRAYGRNRMLRIYPALWTVIVLTCVAASLISGANLLTKEGATWFVAQCVGIIYTPGFLKKFGVGSYNGSLWTIPVELQFYAVLPMLYFVCRKSGVGRTSGVVVACVISLGIALAANLSWENSTAADKLLRATFLPHIYLFLFGVLVQTLKINESSLIRGKWGWWLVIYTAAYALLPPGNLPDKFLMPLMALCVISGAYSACGLSKKILGDQDLSYGVYIYHFLVINLLVELGYRGSWISMVGVLGATYTLAFLSWNFIERPCLRLKKPTMNSSSTYGLQRAEPTL